MTAYLQITGTIGLIFKSEIKEDEYTNCLKKYVFHHKYVMVSVLFDVFFLILDCLKKYLKFDYKL